MLLGPCTPGPRPLLFDIGETLIHFSRPNVLPDFDRGTRRAHAHLRELGLVPPALPRYRACCQRWFLIDFLGALLRGREIDVRRTLSKVHRCLHMPADDTLLLEVCAHSYEPQRSSGRVAADAHAVLHALRQRGHPLAIVSNTMVPGPVLDAHLESEGLLEFFDVRVYSSEVGYKKPHPRIFREALMGLNVKPQGCVFVGDNVRADIRGAGRLGMVTVLKSSRAPRTWRDRPDYVIRHLSELTIIVDRLGDSAHHPVPLKP